MDTSGREVESYWRSKMIDEDKVTPVYKLDEICDLLRSSHVSILKEVSDFIFKRLQHKSPIVKQKSGQVIGNYWSLCQYTRELVITYCDALSSLVPWYAVGEMKRLEDLEIQGCNKMRELFENELMHIHTDTLVVPQLSNLKYVSIISCELLPHILTFSALKTLNQLTELTVKRCLTIQVIVNEENEMPSEVVVFPRLHTLELDYLPSLKGFFMGKNDFYFPSLEHVMINDCPSWRVFTYGELKTPKIKYVHTSLGVYSLECGFDFKTTIFPTSSEAGMPSSSFHNLIEIKIFYLVGTTIIPSHGLLQLQKLESINIGSCRVAEEVFGVVGTGESLYSVVKIPNLKEVNLRFAYDLKYLWKSNQRMVLEFPNLTTVSITFCDSMEHVFTCAMVGSLVQLQDLAITYCNNIEVIIKEEEECDDANVNEIIMLPRLRSLTLFSLKSLKGFCLGNKAFSLPSLVTLEITNCPAITVFTKGHLSTPKLKVIDTAFGMCDVRTDLNSFIETKQEEGNEF